MTETDTKIDKLIDLVAHVESGGDYSKWNPDDNGNGPSFGLIQFNSKKGGLGRLMIAMQKADPAGWDALFPKEAWKPLARELGRLVASFPGLYRGPLQASGKVPLWQKCQRDLARSEYFEPAARLCSRYGLLSERAHAMAFDVAVQYGPTGLANMLASAVQLALHEGVTGAPTERQVLERLADLADTHSYDNERRNRLLKSPTLSDKPLFSDRPRPILAQGQPHGGYLQGLQEQLVALGYLKPAHCRGDFSPALTDAVRVFQKANGLKDDGIVGPYTWQALSTAKPRVRR